jgi:tight adherence protein C
MDIILYLLIIVSVSMVVWGLVLSRQAARLKMPAPSLSGKSGQPRIDLARLLPTKELLEKSKLIPNIKMAIEAAHINMTPQGFFNLKIVLMVGLAFLSVAATGKFNLIFIVIALGLGYAGPDLFLKQKIAQRKYQIARRLPETVDLLSLCIEAGLDFVNSVRWVIEKSPSTPLTEELSFVLEEIKWGKSRIQALKDMARRLDIPEIGSFVQTIIQAERMGTPVAEAFAILSEDSRAQRFHRGERIALQAPIKILLPLIFFIMPVIGIVIGGPILLQFMAGGLLGK